MEKLDTTKTSIRTIVAVLALFVLCAGLIFSFGYYRIGQGKVAGASESIDPAELSQNYQQAYQEALQGYLAISSESDFLSQDFLAKTAAVKGKLLAIKVPADKKDIHLQSVLALDEIERGIKSQDVDLVINNVGKLRQIVTNF